MIEVIFADATDWELILGGTTVASQPTIVSAKLLSTFVKFNFD